MLVEIIKTQITEDKIFLTANNLERILLADNLFEDMDEEPVQFCFDRHAKHGGELKYLYLVCQSTPKTQSAKSFGSKIEKLAGVITNLSDSFRVKQ